MEIKYIGASFYYDRRIGYIYLHKGFFVLCQSYKNDVVTFQMVLNYLQPDNSIRPNVQDVNTVAIWRLKKLK